MQRGEKQGSRSSTNEGEGVREEKDNGQPGLRRDEKEGGTFYECPPSVSFWICPSVRPTRR